MNAPFNPPPPSDPWTPGVRATDVPIAEGGDPSPFADLSGPAPKAYTLRDHFPDVFATKPSEPQLDADCIRRAMYGREQEVVAELLGAEPNPAFSSKRELRWGTKGSFSLTMAGTKRGLWYDHQLKRGGDIFDLIQQKHRCDFVEALRFAQQIVGGYVPAPSAPRPARDDAQDDAEDDAREILRIENAVEIWNQSAALRGTLAEKYLNSRCIDVPDEALGALRFHPECPWLNSKAPAMVALVRESITGEALGIHRTALTPEGGKLGRMALGPISGGVIKLSGESPITTELAIAEGIETALSAMILGLPHAWSVICAGGIAKFPTLPYIDRLTIVIDNDASGTGQRSAAECKSRWEVMGHRVRTIMPPTAGHDLNDVLRAKRDQE